MYLMIRPLHESDYHKNYFGLLDQLSPSSSIPNFSEFRMQIYKFISKSQHVFVIENNGQIIATGTLNIEYKFTHNGGKVAHIEDIIVDQNHRGQGLGKMMVNHLVAEAKNKDCYKVLLSCSNHLKQFYQNLGFVNKNNEMSIYF
jgi:glucosamine-phosphate N-acetyltransferase